MLEFELLGSFNKLEEEYRTLVLEISAAFHSRTGTLWLDGSRGEIRITPGQLRDALAFAVNASHSGGPHDATTPQRSPVEVRVESVRESGRGTGDDGHSGSGRLPLPPA